MPIIREKAEIFPDSHYSLWIFFKKKVAYKKIIYQQKKYHFDNFSFCTMLKYVTFSFYYDVSTLL